MPPHRQETPMLALECFSSFNAGVEHCRFGTLLGVFEGVEVRSCRLPPTLNALDMPPSYHDGIFTGIQWQCVELARRYCLIHFDVVFDPVEMAYQMFESALFRNVHTLRPVSAARFSNGATTPPKKGSLLIWNCSGEYKITGHVAVVVAVTDTHVDIVEQNVIHSVWESGQQYSRRLALSTADDGSHTIQPFYPDEELLGWITLAP